MFENPFDEDKDSTEENKITFKLSESKNSSDDTPRKVEINQILKKPTKDYIFNNRPLIKYYKTGQIFQTIFPDYSGTVFYPNGQVALLLCSTGKYQSLTAFHHNANNPVQLAIFDSNGNGCCNFLNGKIKFQVDYKSCSFFDQTSSNCTKKRLFSKGFSTIHFSLNENLDIEIKDNLVIFLNLATPLDGCTFQIKL